MHHKLDNEKLFTSLLIAVNRNKKNGTSQQNKSFVWV